MQVGIQREIKPYVDYEFFSVKCGVCGLESGAILYKHFDDYDGESLIDYIKESSGYEVNTEAGGLRCKKCDRKNRLLRREQNESNG